MPDIRILALDLDGTLLDSNKNLSVRNQEALAQCAQKGILVVPTTGRFFDMMPACVRDLSFVRYAITINGAQVYDRQEKVACVKEEIPLDIALEVMRLLDSYDVIYDCYRNNWGWMTQAFKDFAYAYAPDKHYLNMIQTFRTGVTELKAHLCQTRHQGDVQKIMLFLHMGKDVSILHELAHEIQVRFPMLKTTSSTGNNLEVNAGRAHKGRALEQFAHTCGLTLENCMAFGDGLNDLTLVQMAGVGVAMANACKEVRRVASYVTTSNDEDGVAEALAHFGLI